jgi:3'-phosphoadenosine 5'-phosphosulfate sulfotransferase (PAPS reductase)/FAD synthetase
MDNSTTSLNTQLLDQIDGLSIAEALKLLSISFPGRVTFSTSFSLEDQVITHHILDAGLPISIFTLDTGRLFGETYSVWNATNERYHTTITAYYPDPARTLVEPPRPQRLLRISGQPQDLLPYPQGRTVKKSVSGPGGLDYRTSHGTFP